MEKQTASYRHIMKYTSLFGTIQGLSILVGIVRNKLIAVILGPNGMGLISLFNSTVKLLGDSTNMGVPMSGVKTISDAYEAGDSTQIADSVKLIRSWGMVCAVAGMLVCAVAAPLIDACTFNWGAHTLHYLLLSPVVALITLTGCEMAVLKAVRRLKALARISVCNVFAVLFLTVPLLYIYGEAAIVPSLLVAALIQAILTIACSYKYYPLSISLAPSYLRGGCGLLKLGVSFVLVGMMGSGMEFLIRSFLNNAGTLETVGLYNAGYMMTMTYGSMVFSAMETDYFPRLSAIPSAGKEMNDCVNRQVEVSVLMITPLLVLLFTGLPVLLPLLFSGKFMPVLPMVQFSIMALFVRAVKLPVAYIPLGRSDSVSYLLMEGAYVLMMLPLMYLCYSQWGLTGTGVAMLLAALADMIMLLCYTDWRYGYKLSRHTVACMSVQLPFLLLACLLTLTALQWLYWILGIVLTAMSVCCSYYMLNRYDKHAGCQ